VSAEHELERTVRSVRFQEALSAFVEEAGVLLRSEVAAGAEVSFEIEPRARRRGSAGAALYCYHALTGEFIAARESALESLPSHAEAARKLADFAGLKRYLTSAGIELGRANARVRARRAIAVLLEDVFAEQTDFEVRAERLTAALERLERAAQANSSEYTVLTTLHGMSISCSELKLAAGLTIAQPDALEGLPEAILGASRSEPAGHLLVMLGGEEEDPHEAVPRALELIKELLCALRLFGDGRVTLGELAWARIGGASWSPETLACGGRPHGMLLVTPEQEDELRAFCNLVSRRTPEGNEIAWALQRFELGCERASAYEALSDYVLALRALLEPEGAGSGQLAGRLAALCATPGQRLVVTERVVQALELERTVIAGTAEEHAGGHALVEDIAGHLRALLRDVICGHLSADLASQADEILIAAEQLSGEQVLGDVGEAEEILDLLI
jgi:hypothetical protein